MKHYRSERPCDDCVLSGRRLRPAGSPNAKYLIVTRAPFDERQIAERRHITGRGGKAFMEELEDRGFSRDEFAFHAFVGCAYKPKETPTKDRHTIQRQCREYLHRVVELQRPEVIIALGAEAAGQVMGRSVKIGKARGIPVWSEEFGTWVMPMLDPGFVSMYPQNVPTMLTDLTAFKRFVDNEYDVEQISEAHGNYEIVDDLQFLIDERPPVMAFDIETLGLRHAVKGNKILTMQFCPEPGRAYMVVWDHPDDPAPSRRKAKLKKQLVELLCHPDTSLVGQNLKYDAVWMYARLNIRIRIDDDTLMLATLLDENQQDKSLDMLTKLHVAEMAGYADAFNQKYNKERMDLVPLDELCDYGCGDVDATLRLCAALLPQVEADSLLYAHYRRVSIPALNAFVPIERRGQLIDEDQLDDFEATLEEYVNELYLRLKLQVPNSIKRKHFDRDKPKNGWSFSRTSFVTDILFNHPDGFRLTPKVYTKATENLAPELKQPSVSTKNHLPYFFEECPFTIDLAECIKATRLLETNVKGFRTKYMEGNRIYPTYSLTTAVTGRTASRDPNGQNFPKRGKQAKAYRKIFIPPPGWILLEADLSQAELRISADMANDRTMIEIYRNNGDIHTMTALIVMGVTLEEFQRLSSDEQKLARFKAKAVNFGFIYGMGWRKFIVYAKTQYGAEFTEPEAQRIRTEYFRRYSALVGWHRAVRAFAAEHKFVRSYSGRIRHLPMIDSDEEYIQQEAQRQAINSPVQEFGSSLGLMSMGRMDQEVNTEYLKLIGFVHDALYAYVRLEHIEWGAKTLKYYMETNPIQEWFGREMRVPIIADVGFGINGSATHEMPTLNLDQPYDFGVHVGEDELEFEVPCQEVPPEDGRKESPEYLKIYA